MLKVILSQGEIRHLNLRIDELGDKLDSLDKDTWKKLVSGLQEISASEAIQGPSAENKDENRNQDGLALAVFGEIERIEARLAKYDEDDKNRKPMQKALERLEETLSELGYEREKLVGKKYVQGKTYEARFVPSKNPDHSTPTITRVYKPMILFKGELIQHAEVEVSECGS